MGLFLAASVSGCLDKLPDGITGDGDTDGKSSQSRQIVITYDEALTARDDATVARGEGITAFNEDAYAVAIDAIETALSGYEEAEDGFAEAADLANEIQKETAADICETAVDETAF
ncbi:hypothetical protein C463_02166 [Halorubrum californiense DSM 19288]|uniref:Uncharacterized protein n=1 Tax=Halorubrum californiense DSM 19288 TaxID=1227465 RepID=M0EL03_9EURY|nr:MULTISPECIES: hypothetical protein [Halorubrum]ELZ47783.1 hypothetical protein C463_02166 [Halorubrum californiense DSM 19288]TKX71202.1 hypothetical protein EXE40_08185 [Halorubrum sp. GN11GM_10-3_MGM]